MTDTLVIIGTAAVFLLAVWGVFAEVRRSNKASKKNEDSKNTEDMESLK
ncbi:MAG: hypothetical protein Q4D81_07110 [Eubacteriales bacterium]|nr:hypothetical protein [Eubacteriales bacterium]